MNDVLRRRVDRVAEGVAACRDRHADLIGTREDAHWHHLIGRDLRGLAEEQGIRCWPEAEDGRWREWAREQASLKLRELLSIFHETCVKEAKRRGLAYPDSCHGLWADDDEDTS